MGSKLVCTDSKHCCLSDASSNEKSNGKTSPKELKELSNL